MTTPFSWRRKRVCSRLRYKMEKEIAFKEALLGRRFAEAKDILSASGVTIDVNCIHTYRPAASHSIAVTECPYK